MEVALKLALEYRARREIDGCLPIVITPGGTSWEVLTRTQRVVAEMICDGLSRTEISEALMISVKTVDTHRGHVMRRLGVRNEVMLVRMAVACGVIGVCAP